MTDFLKKLAAAFFAIVMYVLFASWAVPDEPHYPTEDSCVADYNGRTDPWEIREVEP